MASEIPKEDRNWRIERKLDSITEKVGAVQITLAAQHEVLAEHVRRTNILEAKIEPIQKHVSRVEGALKLIGILGVIATILESIHFLFSK